MDAKTRQVLGVRQFPHPATGGQQGLRRHAAAVHAGAAHVAGFHDRHLEAVLGGVFGRVEPAIAGPDHDHIEVEAAIGRRALAHRAALLLMPGILPRQGAC